MSPPPTTTRFIPYEAESADEHAIAALHLYAYEFARSLLRPGMRVLDVGFGEGYGSEMLAGGQASYLGIETDRETVAHARGRYGADFEWYDGISIPTADETFDMVVSFQVIAFVQDPAPWLRDIRRVLALDGIALLTTPNRVHRLYEGQKPWTRYHAREYVAGEFREALQAAFSDVRVYGIDASDPIRSTVLARGDRARKLARFDPLGIRYRLPDSLNARVRRVIRHAGQPTVSRSDFALDRIWHDVASADTGLDLLALARR
jgi:SAM-dependent methyltransferase